MSVRLPRFERDEVTSGLCGLEIKENIRIDIIGFGNSMATDDRKCDELKYNDPLLQNPYQSNDEELLLIHKEAEELCVPLPKHKDFKECWEQVDPISYFKACHRAMVECLLFSDSDGTDCIPCESFAQYSRSCAEHGVVLEWRSNITQCSKYYNNFWVFFFFSFLFFLFFFFSFFPFFI